MLAATLQGMVTMTELVTTAHDDRVKRSNGAKRNGAASPVLVSASALATHLSCVRSTSRSWWSKA
jgi:hypothetical protein